MDSNQLLVCAVGIQGSGKSTHLKRYHQSNNNSVYISIGDIIRSDPNLNPSLGELIDDSIVNSIFDREITKVSQLSAPEIVLLDGYPRSILQFEHMTNSELIPDSFPVLINWFSAPEAVIKQRLLKRNRSDDSARVIEKRLSEYKTTTIPLIQKLMQDYPIIFKYDTNADKDEVSAIFSTYVNLQLRQLREVQPV